jgi:hypothetical protein
MSEIKENPEIEYWKCEICGKDNFKSIQAMLRHNDNHSAKDPEINISVVAEREAFLERMF